MINTLLRLEAVEAAVGIRQSQIYLLIGRGDFPRPVKIGRLNAWPSGEIQAWIDERIAERESAYPAIIGKMGGDDV